MLSHTTVLPESPRRGIFSFRWGAGATRRGFQRYVSPTTLVNPWWHTRPPTMFSSHVTSSGSRAPTNSWVAKSARPRKMHAVGSVGGCGQDCLHNLIHHALFTGSRTAHTGAAPKKAARAGLLVAAALAATLVVTLVAGVAAAAAQPSLVRIGERTMTHYSMLTCSTFFSTADIPDGLCDGCVAPSGYKLGTKLAYIDFQYTGVRCVDTVPGVCNYAVSLR